MIEQELAAHLTAQIDGVPLFYGSAPEGTPLPYITFVEIDDEDTKPALETDGGNVAYRFGLFCDSGDMLVAIEKRNALRGALKSFEGGSFDIIGVSVRVRLVPPADDTYVHYSVDAEYDYEIREG